MKRWQCIGSTNLLQCKSGQWTTLRWLAAAMRRRARGPPDGFGQGT